MLKFRENDPVTEVRGISTVTWVNTYDICYTKESFKKLLDEEGNAAFIYGAPALRKDAEMCKYAASKGTTIDNLYTFGVLNDEIIIEAMKAAGAGLSPKKFGDQIELLFQRYDLSTELFVKIVSFCPKGESFFRILFGDLKYNKELKEMIRNNKEIAALCISKDPRFYDVISDTLKNDPDILSALQSEEKKVYYGIDGTKFDSIDAAMEYNSSFGNKMSL
jgi:hypothetical protein